MDKIKKILILRGKVKSSNYEIRTASLEFALHMKSVQNTKRKNDPKGFHTSFLVQFFLFSLGIPPMKVHRLYLDRSRSQEISFLNWMQHNYVLHIYLFFISALS